jgi:hypothetical protein
MFTLRKFPTTAALVVMIFSIAVTSPYTKAQSNPDSWFPQNTELTFEEWIETLVESSVFDPLQPQIDEVTADIKDILENWQNQIEEDLGFGLPLIVVPLAVGALPLLDDGVNIFEDVKGEDITTIPFPDIPFPSDWGIDGSWGVDLELDENNGIELGIFRFKLQLVY